MINDLYIYKMSNMQKEKQNLFHVINLISQISFHSAGGEGGEMKRSE